MLVVMLLSSVSNWVEELTTPADMSTAFRSAETYLQMGVSGRQLVEQMILEGCTTEEAEYILENCDADWMEQAVIAARGFREYRDMSDEELLDLLIFQGFSKEEAAYGVKNSK